MNVLELRSVDSPDVDLSNWQPPSPQSVYFILELEVGEVGVVGSDVFQVEVATPEALRSRAKKCVISSRGTLVVTHFCLDEILEEIHQILKKCRARSWDESAAKLQRFFYWEFEDYKFDHLQIVDNPDPSE